MNVSIKAPLDRKEWEGGGGGRGSNRGDFQPA